MDKQLRQSAITALLSLGASILFVVLFFLYREKLANTTPLALIIAFACGWTAKTILEMIKYLRLKKKSKEPANNNENNN